jgi:hypothetical protein
MRKKVIIIVLAVCGVAIGMFFNYGWLTSGETKEFVKDEYNNRRLVEYFNVDTNELKLELIENGDSRWIKHPNCCMEYVGHIPSNKIKFDRNDNNSLVVNGKAFMIEEEK